MQKLLVVCPSRGRVEKANKMIRSFCQTTDKDYSKLVLLLDADDKDLSDYSENISKFVDLLIYDREGDKTFTTEIINKTFNKFPDYEFYSVINDDIEFLTNGWDRKLSFKGKIGTGTDIRMVERYGVFRNGIHIAGFPTISVIDGDIIRDLGWLQYPKLTHCCGDNVWYWFGRRGKILRYDPSVKYIHHTHWYNIVPADSTATRIKDSSILWTDRDIYVEWLRGEIFNDLDKVRFTKGLYKTKEERIGAIDLKNGFIKV